MICDAFAEADPYLHISDAIDDPERYIQLTDYLVRQIELSKAPVRSNGSAHAD
jgi:hypothetical protein